MTDTQNNKEMYKGYIQEALENMRAADLLKVRMAEIKSSVKESGFDPKEFVNVVKAAYNLDKVQETIDSLQAGVDTVDELGL
jgi:cell division protein ZapA (FtsZ GTPase activity inhibitor)